MNSRTLLSRLQRLGTSCRADLARLLGISQPTAGRIVDELLGAGVLEELHDNHNGSPATKGNGRLGRPSRSLRLDAKRPRFLAVHLGVTETLLATLPLALRREDHWTGCFPTPVSAEQWVRQFRAAAEPLVQDELWGVLVSVPGIVDERVGRVLFSPNLPWTAKVDLQESIRRTWNLPVLLIQEERALALGHHAAGPEHDDFLLVDFGEGVGGAVVLGGKIYSSPLPVTCELGHTPVLCNSRVCGCGAVGCVETLVSTRGLVQSFALAAPSETQTWPAFVRYVTENGVTGWLTEALDATGAVIAGALNAFGLGRVVLTGSLTELGNGPSDYLSRAIKKGTMWGRFGEVECITAERRRSAGLVAVGIDRLVIPMSEPSRTGRN